MPASIVQAGTTTFVYDADHNRTKESSDNGDIYFVALGHPINPGNVPLFEKHADYNGIGATGVTHYRHFIAGAPTCYAAMEAHVAGYQTWLAGGDRTDVAGAMIMGGAIGFIGAGGNVVIGQTFGTAAGFSISNVLAHAVFGCATASAAGGSCGAGALSSAITAGVDQINTGSFWAGAALAMAAGCVGSAAGGGTCAAGIASSALVYIYNACGSPNGCAALGGAAGTFVGIAASGVCNVGTALACGPANGLILGAAIVGGAAAGAAIDSIAVHGNSWLSPSPTTVYQLVYVDSGDLYKYGITDGFNTRYSVNFLTRMGFAMENIATFNSRAPARMLELSLCFGYVAGHGGLPPGSSRC